MCQIETFSLVVHTIWKLCSAVCLQGQQQLIGLYVMFAAHHNHDCFILFLLGEYEICYFSVQLNLEPRGLK